MFSLATPFGTVGLMSDAYGESQSFWSRSRYPYIDLLEHRCGGHQPSVWERPKSGGRAFALRYTVAFPIALGEG